MSNLALRINSIGAVSNSALLQKANVTDTPYPFQLDAVEYLDEYVSYIQSEVAQNKGTELRQSLNAGAGLTFTAPNIRIMTGPVANMPDLIDRNKSVSQFSAIVFAVTAVLILGNRISDDVFIHPLIGAMLLIASASFTGMAYLQRRR